jgi:glutathione synthase
MPSVMGHADAFRDGTVTARCGRRGAREQPFSRWGESSAYDLSTDVVLMRRDPPFDMAAIIATITGAAATQDAGGERSGACAQWPEKPFVTEFKELMPPTLITPVAQDRRVPRRTSGIIPKPPRQWRRGRVRVKATENMGALLECSPSSIATCSCPPPCPEVRQGDKRIILVDGDRARSIAFGQGEARSICMSAQPGGDDVTAREKDICARSPPTETRGLIFTGRVIGAISPRSTSPRRPASGSETLGGANIAAMIWDAIEKKVKRTSRLSERRRSGSMSLTGRKTGRR